MSTRAQHMIALDEANRIRSQRSAAKKAIKAGHVAPADLFKVKENFNLTVGEVLTAQQRWGRVRAQRFLNSPKLGNWRKSIENVKLCELTFRERRALTDAITSTAERARNGKPTEGEEQDD